VPGSRASTKQPSLSKPPLPPPRAAALGSFMASQGASEAPEPTLSARTTAIYARADSRTPSHGPSRERAVLSPSSELGVGLNSGLLFCFRVVSGEPQSWVATPYRASSPPVQTQPELRSY
jgi:hypothetical protein